MPSGESISPEKATETAWIAPIVQSLRGAEYDYTSGSLKRAIILLSVPMVLEMSMEALFAICDVYFVGRLGPKAVATVGFTEAMLTIIYALAIGLAMGTTALVARRIGEKNTASAARAATQAIIAAIALGVVTGLPCAIFAKDLLALMGADEEVIAIGSGYTAILLGSNIVITLLYLNNAIFRGAGDAVIAMKVLIVANGINLLLDPCLIFGLGPFPELGVTGAAIATTIGRGTGVLYQLVALRRGRGRFSLRGVPLRIHGRLLRELLRVSAGGAMQLFIATTSWVVLMRIVSPFGESAVAGYTIAIRIVIFALLPSWGLANAAATLVGQNLGAARPDRAERAVWLTGWFNTAFLGIVTIIFVSFAEPLVALFASDTSTIDYGGDALRIISLGYVFYAWGMVLTQAFNGAGDTNTPTKLNLVCFWFLQIPSAWILANEVGMGPSGVFWAVAGAESILAIAAMVVFRLGHWKETRMAPDPAD